MTLPRFLFVLLLVTVVAGAIGAAAGALFGMGMPRQIQARGSAERSDREGGDSKGTQGEVSLGVQADRSPVGTGAAFGGGIGLLIGGPCGLLVGLLDQ